MAVGRFCFVFLLSLLLFGQLQMQKLATKINHSQLAARRISLKLARDVRLWRDLRNFYVQNDSGWRQAQNVDNIVKSIIMYNII